MAFCAALLLSVASLLVVACGGRSSTAGSIDAGTPDADAGECTGAKLACDASCVDPLSDREHCGGCDRACPAGERCRDGACVLDCPGGQVACGGRCIDPATDPDHCGGCQRGTGAPPFGQACSSGEVCTSGTCLVGCGVRGTVLCDRRCVDPFRDREHCGGCAGAGGTSCGPSDECLGGVCSPRCPPELAWCGDACRDLTSDQGNCGACGRVCLDGQSCRGGTCQVTCAAGLVDCGGSCRNLRNDPNHCGGCGVICPGAAVCALGLCEPVCTEGLEACGSACVDPRSDPAHCGGCGQACSSGQACVNGACETLAARCTDIVTDMPVWGQPSRGVDLRAYTASTLHWLGCTLGCPPETFYCAETETTLRFGTSGAAAMRALVDPANQMGDVIPSTFTACCSASAPMEVCNAPMSDANGGLGAPTAVALCRALGYDTGRVLREGSGNFCPEPHATAEDGSAWTSDFVHSDGYGAEYECSL